MDFFKYITEKRDALRKKYRRVLPINEILFDRFEKAEYLGFGQGSSVYDSCLVMGDVSVGRNVWIGPFTILDGYHAKLTIGDGVVIASGAQIYTHDTGNRTLSEGIEEVESGDVAIGSYTTVGVLSMVCMGVKIGSHCMIQPYSLVTKDVEDYSIVAGNPAKKIGAIEIIDGKVVKKYFHKK